MVVAAAVLQGLHYAVDANPVSPSFPSMHLFRAADLRAAAVAKWGSWEAAQRERRRRLTRS